MGLRSVQKETGRFRTGEGDQIQRMSLCLKDGLGREMHPKAEY